MKLISRKKKQDVPRRRLAEARIEEQQVAEEQLFRRNRTISGSASRHVASTGTDNLQSERTKSHAVARRRKHIGGILLLSAGILALLIVLISQFTARVEIAHTDTKAITAINNEAYQETLNKYLARYPLDRFRFVTNHERLQVYMRDAHPEIERIVPGGIAGFGASRFDMVVRRPVASWNIQNENYYTDKNGVSFQQNYYPEPTVRVVDNSGATTGDAGKAIVSMRLLAFIGQVVDDARNAGLQVKEVELPPATTRQVDVRLENGKQVRMTVDREAGEQVRDAKKTLDTLAARSVSYDYIDVRVAGKAYYK